MTKTNQRNRQTRQQRKREAMHTAIMAVLLVVLCAVLTVWALGVWAEHPGEQQISGTEYVASLQNGGEREW